MNFVDENPKNVNSHFKDGTSVLNYCIYQNDTILFQYLIQKGVKINLSTMQSPFIAAIDSNRIDIVKALYHYGADVNISMPLKINKGEYGYWINGYNPLYYANFTGRLEIANYLKSVGAKTIEKINPELFTEFFGGKFERVKEIIATSEKMPETITDTIYYFNANREELWLVPGDFLLHFLITKNLNYGKGKERKELVSLMIDKGNSIHEKPEGFILNAFFNFGVSDEDYDFYKKLISKGAIVTNETLITAIAKCSNCFKLFELFIQNGANPNAKYDQDNLTIKDWAIKQSKVSGQYYKETEAFFGKY